MESASRALLGPVLGFGAGFCVALMVARPADTPAATPAQLAGRPAMRAAARRPLGPQERPTAALEARRGSLEVVAAGAKPASERGVAAGSERGARLAALLARLELPEAEDEHEDERALELMAALEADPGLVDLAAAELRPGEPLDRLELLASALAASRTPGVERAAVSLARDGLDDQERVLGLELLGRLGTPRVIPVAADILDARESEAVTGAAVSALPPPRGLSLEQSARVQDSLSRLGQQAASGELRRRAIIAHADWSGDRGLQRAALQNDPDPTVRAGAAFAFERSGGCRGRDLELLAAVMSNASEDPLVRENAWRAVGASGPLPGKIAALYRGFARSREATARPAQR